MSGVIRFDISAYLKIVLHASKYPSECIGGFLIRNVGSSSDNNISDAIPVYHGAPVAPLLEFAAETTSAMNMHIIGVYFANEIASNKIAPLFVERMCESVALKNSGVCILAQLDGNLLGEKTQLCINVSKICIIIAIIDLFGYIYNLPCPRTIVQSGQ